MLTNIGLSLFPYSILSKLFSVDLDRLSDEKHTEYSLLCMSYFIHSCIYYGLILSVILLTFFQPSMGIAAIVSIIFIPIWYRTSPNSATTTLLIVISAITILSASILYYEYDRLVCIAIFVLWSICPIVFTKAVKYRELAAGILVVQYISDNVTMKAEVITRNDIIEYLTTLIIYRNLLYPVNLESIAKIQAIKTEISRFHA